MSRIIVIVPLVLFMALAALFFFRLGSGDPSRIPSALVGHPAPLMRFLRWPSSNAPACRSRVSMQRA
jgi:hypothetical protein